MVQDERIHHEPEAELPAAGAQGSDPEALHPEEPQTVSNVTKACIACWTSGFCAGAVAVLVLR